MGSNRVKKAGRANTTMGLRRQAHQNGGVEGTTHLNPKILINRVQKPEQRRSRDPKTPVACDHCRSVVESRYTSSTDTKPNSRRARVKCSGEAPSCQRCLGKGKQCGYHKSTTSRWQAQVAAARDSIQNPSAGASSQPLEWHGTHHRVLAPRNDAWNLPVDQVLRQSTPNNSPISTNGVQDYPLDLSVQSPVQAFSNTLTNGVQ